MRRSVRWSFWILLIAIWGGAATTPSAVGQAKTNRTPAVFPRGSFTHEDQLPPGRFRSEIESLPAQARDRARAWLAGIQFAEADLESLHVDPAGGVYFVCGFSTSSGASTSGAPLVSEASVPLTPFPTNLIFHSRPGSANILYLNFSGENVSGTQWNTLSNRTVFNATAFSMDGDFTTFSDAEQTAIKRIWQRVAEDYAPFDVDVTTERPVTFTTRTAHALITRSMDANNLPNPASSAGGVAYVNVFARSDYAIYRPGWIYSDRLGPNEESFIAEAVSHEIGHNMGLSHDSCPTCSFGYYAGHGSGETSWAPIMGTGYNQNVSQWSKGEYYQASNAEDDLSTIAGKLTYRADDIGSALVTARALVISNGTNIVSTTPENDPTNANTANKGVIERNNDTDMFSFVTGSGLVNITVKPWAMPTAYTLGGNLDVSLELYNDAGALILTNNGASVTSATIQTNLSAGKYYLLIKNSGTGSPLSSGPTGYTSYGSIGQYFISGSVRDSVGVVVPPLAQATIADITSPGIGAKQFTVSYSDDVAVNVATIDSNDLRVTGPSGYNQLAQFLSLNLAGNGTPRVATYSIPPPNGVEWLPGDAGLYSINLLSNQVADVENAYVPPSQLAQFNVAVPVVVYSANMTTDPGWTLQPDWEYGAPNYGSAGPAGGFTGSSIIGYNLSGNYGNNLSLRYATTPVINTSGSTSLTLQFRRWLGLKNRDDAVIEVSTNGSTWIPVWAATGAVNDNAWTLVQYSLPGSVIGSSTLRLRWGLGSGQSQNDIGWNIDDVQLLAGGAIDVAAPVANLTVGNVTGAGAPSQTCSVTYSDNTAVNLATLDDFDLLVTGPNNYSNALVFVGADLPGNGSPLTGSYDIPAPGGTWDVADNGSYTITLLSAQVSDTNGNTIPGQVLGGFSVAIPQVPLFAVNLSVAQPGWGAVTPSNGLYPQGTNLQLVAAPASYYAFSHWAGDSNSTSNPLGLTVAGDFTAQAVFAELLTTNHATPHWWLAQYGFTNNFESAADAPGANGMAFWQSYIAGLDPTNPASRLVLQMEPLSDGSGLVLSWDAVAGRTYSLWSAEQAWGAYALLPGATNLVAPTEPFTNFFNPSVPGSYFRLQVQKP